MEKDKNVTPEMMEMMESLATLAERVSDEVYDDDCDDGTAGILHLCDMIVEKIDAYAEKRNS